MTIRVGDKLVDLTIEEARALRRELENAFDQVEPGCVITASSTGSGNCACDKCGG